MAGKKDKPSTITRATRSSVEDIELLETSPSKSTALVPVKKTLRKPATSLAQLLPWKKSLPQQNVIQQGFIQSILERFAPAEGQQKVFQKHFFDNKSEVDAILGSLAYYASTIPFENVDALYSGAYNSVTSVEKNWAYLIKNSPSNYFKEILATQSNLNWLLTTARRYSRYMTGTSDNNFTRSFPSSISFWLYILYNSKGEELSEGTPEKKLLVRQATEFATAQFDTQTLEFYLPGLQLLELGIAQEKLPNAVNIPIEVPNSESFSKAMVVKNQPKESFETLGETFCRIKKQAANLDLLISKKQELVKLTEENLVKHSMELRVLKQQKDAVAAKINQIRDMMEQMDEIDTESEEFQMRKYLKTNNTDLFNELKKGEERLIHETFRKSQASTGSKDKRKSSTIGSEMPLVKVPYYTPYSSSEDGSEREQNRDKIWNSDDETNPRDVHNSEEFQEEHDFAQSSDSNKRHKKKRSEEGSPSSEVLHKTKKTKQSKSLAEESKVDAKREKDEKKPHKKHKKGTKI